MTQTDTTATCCCPPFDPAVWNDKTHIWQEKLFITDNVRQVFHIPLNIRSVIQRTWNKVVAAKANLPANESLILFYDPSPWRSELFLSVSQEVPNAKNVRFSGTFVSRVFEGPYHAVPKWLREMDAGLKTQGKTPLKYYVHYPYCPKCAQKYGQNYGVVFAQVK
jgi:hypothetical protein